MTFSPVSGIFLATEVSDTPGEGWNYPAWIGEARGEPVFSAAGFPFASDDVELEERAIRPRIDWEVRSANTQMEAAPSVGFAVGGFLEELRAVRNGTKSK